MVVVAGVVTVHLPYYTSPTSHLLHNHSGDMTTVTPYLVSCISTSGWMVNYGTFFSIVFHVHQMFNMNQSCYLQN